MELHNLYGNANIIRTLKSRRLRWAGHVARIGWHGVLMFWWQWTFEFHNASELVKMIWTFETDGRRQNTMENTELDVRRERKRRYRPTSRILDEQDGEEGLIWRRCYGQRPLVAEDHCEMKQSHCRVKYSLIKKITAYIPETLSL